MRAVLSTFGFVLLVAASAVASPAPSETYGKDPLVSDMKLSPSGEKIVYTQSSKGVRTVVVAKTDGSLIRAFNAGEQRIDGYEFIGDDTLITYRSVTTSFGGMPRKYEVHGAIATHLDAGTSRQLLSRSRQVHFPQLQLDRIVGPSSREGYVLMAAFAITPQQAPKYSLFRANLKNGGATVIARGVAETVDWFVDADETVRAREDFDNRANQHRIWARAGKSWRPIYTEMTEMRRVAPLGLSPESDGLVLISPDPRGEYTAAFHMSLDDGSIGDPVFFRKGHDVEDLIRDGSGRIVGVRYSGLTPSYEFYDPDLTESVDKLVKQWPDNSVIILSTTIDRSKVLFLVSGRSTSGLYGLWDRATEQISTIARQRPDIPSEDVAPVLTYHVKARDGLEIPTLITVPPGVTAPENLPTVVIPHGGPESYDRIQFDAAAQFFASRGYLVVQPNFRGSSGFGHAHTASGYGRWGKEMQDDVTDALLHAVRAGAADPKRVCIFGGSYGGYAALVGGAVSSELYRCIVAVAPVSDLPLMLKEGRQKYGRDHWVMAYWEDLVGDRKEDIERLREVSPARQAGKFRAPVLLIHGDADTIVPIQQSRRMKSALEKAGKDVKFVRLKGATHDFADESSRVRLLTEAGAFVDRHLGRAEASTE